MALVIWAVFLTETIRRRMSRVLGIKTLLVCRLVLVESCLQVGLNLVVNLALCGDLFQQVGLAILQEGSD